MSIVASVQKSLTVAGENFPQSSTVVADAAIVQSVSVPAAEAGMLSVRTSVGAGTLSVNNSDHSFSVNDIVDLYWNGGARRSVKIGTVSGTVCTILEGAGDDLPTQGTTVFISPCVLLESEVVGTKIKAIFLYTENRGQITFMNSDDAEQFHKELGFGSAWEWLEGNGTQNPFKDAIVSSVLVSNAAEIPGALKVAILYNN